MGSGRGFSAMGGAQDGAPHQSWGVKDVAWSPLVPYWVAAAGERGQVCVWDIRYGKEPVWEACRHSNSVESVAWSNSHCEMVSP